MQFHLTKFMSDQFIYQNSVRDKFNNQKQQEQKYWSKENIKLPRLCIRVQIEERRYEDL